VDVRYFRGVKGDFLFLIIVSPPILTDEQQRRLLAEVCALVEAVANEQAPQPPEIGDAEQSVEGAFVTLMLHDRLRGCYGCFGEAISLGQAIYQAAVGAAYHDPRFPRLVSVELMGLEVEISLLHGREPIPGPAAQRSSQIEIGVHGLDLATDKHRGLLLPKVGAQLQLSPDGFLSQVCQKANAPLDAWRSEQTKVHRFQAMTFGGPFPFRGGW